MWSLLVTGDGKFDRIDEDDYSREDGYLVSYTRIYSAVGSTIL